MNSAINRFSPLKNDKDEKVILALMLLSGLFYLDDLLSGSLRRHKNVLETSNQSFKCRCPSLLVSYCRKYPKIFVLLRNISFCLCQYRC